MTDREPSASAPPMRGRLGALIASMLCVLVGAAGCLGGAQPVPPALDPTRGVDGGGAPRGDAGAEGVDAGASPLEVDLAGLDDKVKRPPWPVFPRPGWPAGWRPRDFGPPSTSSDAGSPTPAPASEGVDGPDGS